MEACRAFLAVVVLAACALIAHAQPAQYGPNAEKGRTITANNWAYAQAAGWSLTGYNGINNQGGNNRCDRSKFHFYANNANTASLSVTLNGTGCARITFSNCWNTASSSVGVYLGSTPPYTLIAQTVDTLTPSPVVTHEFSYTDGQVLVIQDLGANAVAEIDSVVFLQSCTQTQFGPNAALGTSINGNNYNAMVAAGWSFLSAANGIGNQGLNNDCGENQFHFYANGGAQARLTATLSGAGCAEITFSNCWMDPNSFVGIWLAGNRIAQTLTTAPSPLVTFRFSYTNGQLFEIRDEGANAVVEVDSLYFLSACSDAPTAAPTAAPSGWWQQNNIPNITDMYARLQGTESSLVSLSTVMTTQASQLSAAIYNLGGVVGAIDNTIPSLATQLSQNIAGVSTQVSTLSTQTSTNIGTISTSVSSLVASLRTAVQNAAVGPGGSASSAPQVSSSSSNDLVFTTGANVMVTSGQCVNSDLCGAASFAANLKQALQNV